MEETLRQLGGLLLGAIPTVIIMITLALVYWVVLHRPLVKVLAERRSKTEGAVEQARADIAASEARTADYEKRLREARAALFKTQEARRQKLVQAREASLTEARSRAHAQIEQARAAIQQDKEKAQAALQGEAADLAQEIIRTVLQPAAQGGVR